MFCRCGGNFRAANLRPCERDFFNRISVNNLSANLITIAGHDIYQAIWHHVSQHLCKQNS
jgi:hypothetical protein